MSVVQKVDIGRHPFDIRMTIDCLMILEGRVYKVHDLGDLRSHSSLQVKGGVFHLVHDQPLEHGHAQIEVEGEIVHCWVRSELFMISD